MPPPRPTRNPCLHGQVSAITPDSSWRQELDSAQHKAPTAAASARPWPQERAENQPSPKLHGAVAPFEHWKKRGSSKAEITACDGSPTLLVTTFSLCCSVTPPPNCEHLQFYKGILLPNASKAHSSFLEIRLKKTHFCAPTKNCGKLSSTSFTVPCLWNIARSGQTFLLVLEKYQDIPK